MSYQRPRRLNPYAVLNFATKDTSGHRVRAIGNAAFWRSPQWLDITGLNIANGDSLPDPLDGRPTPAARTTAWRSMILPFPFAGTGIPRITFTSPADTARNVARAVPVRIGFSERMKPASLAYTCSPNPGGWSAVWNANCDTVTLNHGNFGILYKLYLHVTAARDSNENYSLAAGSKPNPFSFTTQSDPAAPPMYITVLDVGQAAATVIKSPTGKRILIDAYCHHWNEPSSRTACGSRSS